AAAVCPRPVRGEEGAAEAGRRQGAEAVRPSDGDRAAGASSRVTSKDATFAAPGVIGPVQAPWNDTGISTVVEGGHAVVVDAATVVVGAASSLQRPTSARGGASRRP